MSRAIICQATTTQAMMSKSRRLDKLPSTTPNLAATTQVVISKSQNLDKLPSIRFRAVRSSRKTLNSFQLHFFEEIGMRGHVYEQNGRPRFS